MATGTIKSTGWKLLWTNPNPSAEFAAQTISLDLSSYKEVLLVYRLGTYWNELDSVLITEFDATYALHTPGYDGRISKRNVIMKSSGATFSAAGYYNQYATASSYGTDNKLKVPYKIYAR